MALTADQYIQQHWLRKKVWRNLESPKHLRRFAICVEVMEGETFADVGCALGHSTAKMAALLGGESAWTGIDFSAAAINGGRPLFKALSFIHAPDPTALATCGPFDSVVCSEVLEHVENDREIVDALYAIARKVVVLTTPCIRVNDPGHLRVYTEEELQTLCAGKNATIENLHPFWRVVLRHD